MNIFVIVQPCRAELTSHGGVSGQAGLLIGNTCVENMFDAVSVWAKVGNTARSRWLQCSLTRSGPLRTRNRNVCALLWGCGGVCGGGYVLNGFD